jgi:hypothetical protein
MSNLIEKAGKYRNQGVGIVKGIARNAIQSVKALVR